MRILVLTLSLALLAAPCLADTSAEHGDYLVVASAEKDKSDKKDNEKHGGKVVIKGKGGKVTDVKKPRKKK